MPKDKRTVEFLKDLERISRKHGLVVEGCGCCGSPRIEEIGDRDTPSFTYSTSERNALMWIRFKKTK